jgi:hypothetical protein
LRDIGVDGRVILKWKLEEAVCECGDRIRMGKDTTQGFAVLNNEVLIRQKSWEFLD